MIDNKLRYDSFKKFLSSLSEEEIDEINKKEHAGTEKQYYDFVAGYKENRCYLCNSSFKTFSKTKVCIHWLLNPKGFRKKNFPLIYQKFSFFGIQSYLRWIANQEKIFGNINDLIEEKDSDKIIDLTIKYKNLEWSFSISTSDFKGHQNSIYGKQPHYHFQMRIEKKPFINYSDFHIPLTEPDIFALESIIEKSDNIKCTFPFGEGMETVLSELTPEEIIKHTRPTEDESKGAFKFSSFVSAKPGKLISGEDFYKLIEESKEKNVPLASLLHKLDAEVTTIISPAPSVPEIAHRTKRNRGKTK